MSTAACIAPPSGCPAERSTLENLDPAALRSIEPVLRGFAFRAVRRQDLVDDLVQETLLAAWQSRASFQGRSSLRTWMVGILSRKIVDHYRRNRRETPTDDVPEPDPLLTTHDPSGRMDAVRARRVIDRHLHDLTELERMAVLLCDVEGVDRQGAAGSLGVTRGHLRVLLHRGRHRLRRVLERADLIP